MSPKDLALQTQNQDCKCLTCHRRIRRVLSFSEEGTETLTTLHIILGNMSVSSCTCNANRLFLLKKKKKAKMLLYICWSSYRSFDRHLVCSNYHQKNILVHHWKTKIKAAYLLQIHVFHIRSNWGTVCFWLLCFSLSCMFALQHKLYNAFDAKCMAGVCVCSVQQQES